MDLQKAFDCVDHNILCRKLNIMGIGSVRWFESYLSDRKQVVCLNSVQSDAMDITCGVPQGSILGPLLFLCYINDMSVSVKCRLVLYADDSALLVSGDDPKYIASRLEDEFSSCSKWFIDNKLSMHPAKTEAILFCTKKKLDRAQGFSINCSGHIVTGRKTVKYLGLQLDQCLSGELIAQSVISKCMARLKFLYRHANCLDQYSRKTLCQALIQCHMDYSCSSWFSGLNKSFKSKLQICQNKIVRFILNLGPRSHIGQGELDQLGLLSVQDRASQLKLHHVYKIFHRSAPSYMYK